MKRIGVRRPLTIDTYVAKAVKGAPDDQEMALQELFDWVVSQPELQAVLEWYGTDPKTLRSFYDMLIAYGGGQWAGGTFVAAAAMTREDTLAHIHASVNAELPEGWDEQDRWLKLAFDLIEYFRVGRPLANEG